MLPSPSIHRRAPHKSTFLLAATLIALASAASNSSIYQPPQGASWDILLRSPWTSSTTVNVSVLDVDLLSNAASTIAALQDNGSNRTHVICYFSAGTYENWRTDWNATADQIGLALPEWPGEYWCDTRLQSVRDVMISRIQVAADRGCDAVDPDNVDGYQNDNGLGLTEADAVDYINFLSSEAHSRGLGIGLKNALSIVDNVTDNIEFAVNEQCHANRECDLYHDFVNVAGKNVFQIEYPKGSTQDDDQAVQSDKAAAICDDPATQRGFSTIMKNMNLDSFVESCIEFKSLASTSSSNQTSPSNSSSSGSRGVCGSVEARLGAVFAFAIAFGSCI